jgi:hypothetical protein
MDFNSTIDLIIKDLKEASEIIDDLKKYPGVPAIQVELAKSKCKSAGDVIALLKNQNAGQSEPDIIIEKPVQNKYIAETKAPAEKFKEPVAHKDIEDHPHQPVQTNPPAQPKKTKEPEKKIREETTIADKFAPAPDLYEEQLSNKFKEKELSEQLKLKPIKNLSDAIGLNDRFLFISEIFNGNKDNYTQAISRLDQTENLQDAMAIIMSYTGEKGESEAVVQLLDLVRLKFPPNV